MMLGAWWHRSCDAHADSLRSTIADLRQRLDEAATDRRQLTDRLTTTTTIPAPTVDAFDGMLSSRILDEIELVAMNGAMRTQLQRWARAELARGATIEAVAERIREGDQAPIPGPDE